MKSRRYSEFERVWSGNEAAESELEAWFGYGGWRTWRRWKSRAWRLENGSAVIGRSTAADLGRETPENPSENGRNRSGHHRVTTGFGSGLGGYG